MERNKSKRFVSILGDSRTRSLLLYATVHAFCARGWIVLAIFTFPVVVVNSHVAVDERLGARNFEDTREVSRKVVVASMIHEAAVVDCFDVGVFLADRTIVW